MPEPDIFQLDLPGEPSKAPGEVAKPKGDAGEADAKVVKLFPGGGEVETAAPAQPPAVAEPSKPGVLDRVAPAVERSLARFADGWRAGWVGDGVLGMRPRPVADLARQFWTAPPPYIADALILRIPYAVYGLVVIPISAAGHLVLFVISYPSLLAGALLLAIFLSLFV